MEQKTCGSLFVKPLLDVVRGGERADVNGGRVPAVLLTSI